MPPDKDRTRRSGEHRVDDDTTENEQMSTLGAVGAEVRSIRRENKIQFGHLNDRISEIVDAIKIMSSSHQEGMQHCASHDAVLHGHDGRIKRVETHIDESKQKSTQTHVAQVNVWSHLAANKSLPWALVALIGLIVVMSSLTGRDAKTLVPYTPPAPTPAAPTSGAPP